MPNAVEIGEAIGRLVARGEVVSVRRIRKELGESGSHEQILPVLAAWREAQRAQNTLSSPIPVVLTESALAFVSQCWGLAERKASDEAKDARRGADQRVASLESQVAELTIALDESEHEVGQLKLDYANLLQKRDTVQESLTEIRGRAAVSAREIVLLRERIADLSGRQGNKKKERSPKKTQKQPAAPNI